VPVESLTPTEKRVLEALIATGVVGHAADRLDMALATARVHVRALHRKTETHAVGELIIWGLAHLGDWHSG